MSRVEVARTVADSDDHVLVYGGREYTLPALMPLTAIESMEDGKVIDFLRALLGDDQYADFRVDAVVDDMDAIADAIGKLYGQAPGESGASGGSS